jgi:hypothetical protein
MTQAAEAILDPTGTIRLLEPIPVTRPTRVMVTIVPETLAEQYARAKVEVSTAELDAAAAEVGGRSWADIRKRLCGQ